MAYNKDVLLVRKSKIFIQISRTKKIRLYFLFGFDT